MEVLDPLRLATLLPSLRSVAAVCGRVMELVIDG
jgi:hypothetical protein